MHPRLRYLLITGGIIVLGLATRMDLGWPVFIAEHAGDVLYATMLLFGLRILVPDAEMWQVAAGSLAWCWTIECLQLVDALEPLRRTLPGRLVLGSTFVWIDFLRYTIGVALGVGLDTAIRSRSEVP